MDEPLERKDCILRETMEDNRRLEMRVQNINKIKKGRNMQHFTALNTDHRYVDLSPSPHRLKSGQKFIETMLISLLVVFLSLCDVAAGFLPAIVASSMKTVLLKSSKPVPSILGDESGRLFHTHTRSLALPMYASRESGSALHAMFDLQGSGSGTLDIAPKSLSNLGIVYNRASTVSWWCQIILSVISGVILTFANSVRRSSGGALWSSGFALSGLGVTFAFMNSFWTWAIGRLSRRIINQKIDDNKVVPTCRRYSRLSLYISLAGMFLSLIAAEQIVGTLASKVLSSQGYVPVMNTAGLNANPQIQALDIFLVQANTNAIVSHFVPLVSSLWCQLQLPSYTLQSSDFVASEGG